MRTRRFEWPAGRRPRSRAPGYLTISHEERGHRDASVDGDQQPAFPAARHAVTDGVRHSPRRLRPWRPARTAGTSSGSAGVTRNESSATAGNDEQRDLRARRDRDLGGELEVARGARSRPRRRAPPRCRRSPRSRTTMKNSREADRVPRSASSEWTRISLISAVTAVAAPSATSERFRLHACSSASSVCAARCCRRFQNVTAT